MMLGPDTIFGFPKRSSWSLLEDTLDPLLARGTDSFFVPTAARVTGDPRDRMPPKRPAKQPRRSSRPRRRRGALLLAAALTAGVVINLRVFVWDTETSIDKVREMALQAKGPAPAGGPALAPSNPAIEADEVDDPGNWTPGEVARGDTLGRILRHRGLPTADADAILRALEPHCDLRLIRPGQRFRLHAR